MKRHVGSTVTQQCATTFNISIPSLGLGAFIQRFYTSLFLRIPSSGIPNAYYLYRVTSLIICKLNNSSQRMLVSSGDSTVRNSYILAKGNVFMYIYVAIESLLFGSLPNSTHIVIGLIFSPLIIM